MYRVLESAMVKGRICNFRRMSRSSSRPSISFDAWDDRTLSVNVAVVSVGLDQPFVER